METIRKAIGFILMFLAVMIFVGTGCYGCFHPDMTEMRIFLNTWPEQALGWVLLIVGYLLYTWGEQE